MYISNETTSIEVDGSFEEWIVEVNGERKSFKEVEDMWCYIESFREKFNQAKWERFLDEVFEEMKVEERRKKQNAYFSFRDYIIERLDEIDSKLVEVKDFIEKDTYAKENAEEIEFFLDDINNLIDSMEHIYDNLPDEP